VSIAPEDKGRAGLDTGEDGGEEGGGEYEPKGEEMEVEV
jgi:hypothetical protein